MTLLATLWQYRDLALKLASKEIKVRYKHPILGLLWALIVPFSLILIFNFIFSAFLKVSDEEISFVAYISAAMFPWTFFQLTVGNSTTCIVDSGSLIKKVYFPREIIPVSIVLANLFNFLFSLLILIFFLRFLSIHWSWRLIILPLIISLQFLLSLGVALLVSALHVEFRDMKYIVEIALTLLFYLVPVFYSFSILEQYSPVVTFLYMMNPMVGIVSFYRWALLPGYAFVLPGGISWGLLMGYTVSICIAIFILGQRVFRRRQMTFADWV